MYFDPTDVADVAALIAVAAYVAWIISEMGRSPPPSTAPPERGRYLPAEAIDQADRGRTVTIERLFGPDLELTADLDEEE